MSDSFNPYGAAQETAQAEPIANGAINTGESFPAITEDMISSMKQSSSWIRFLAICGFIYAGFILAAGVICAGVFIFAGSSAGNNFAAELGMNPLMFGVIISILFLALGILFIIPIRFLYNFGTNMRSYVQTSNDSALELAFANNKSFWKFCGIWMIVFLALIPAAIIISLIIIGVMYV